MAARALSRGSEISGKTLGLVGFGGIGRLTGRLGRAMGMRVIGSDAQIPDDAAVWAASTPPARWPSTRCSALADVVSLHVPLIDSTRNLIDAATARADEARRDPDQHRARRHRRRGCGRARASIGALGGAALDVFDHEPLPAGSPLVDCPNLLLTPHIAGVTVESNLRVSMLVADKVAAALRTVRSPG